MEPTPPNAVATETVRLAIDAPAPIAERAAFTVAQLLASACIAVGRTGSVILPWPCPALPFDPTAWADPEAPADADPIAFAFHRLSGARPCSAPETDAIRGQVHAWAQAERLRLGAPWPEDARCAVALLHADYRPPPGLRDRLRRRDPLAYWAAIAEVDQAWSAQTRLATRPRDDDRIVALGLADAQEAAIAVEQVGTFHAGTAFPYRRYDAVTDRPTATIVLPVAARGDADTAIGAIADLARRGGGGAVILEHRATDDVVRYEAVLRAARLNGAWCVPPASIADRMPLR
jgi:hypothetical protein